MFNLGAGELAIIFIVLIIAVGPDRLPTMMKGLGKAIRTVRAASREIRTTVGIDEMMREDVLAPPRRPPPKAAISRPTQPAQPAAPAAETAAKPDADAQSANAAPSSSAPSSSAPSSSAPSSSAPLSAPPPIGAPPSVAPLAVAPAPAASEKPTLAQEQSPKTPQKEPE
jgi:sec-independent protein translocase protein TatB